MVIGIVLAIIDGWNVTKAVIYGLLVGPGWLALLTIVGFVMWLFGWGSNGEDNSS
jgi:hypothetical protein